MEKLMMSVISAETSLNVADADVCFSLSGYKNES